MIFLSIVRNNSFQVSGLLTISCFGAGLSGILEGAYYDVQKTARELKSGARSIDGKLENIIWRTT